MKCCNNIRSSDDKERNYRFIDKNSIVDRGMLAALLLNESYRVNRLIDIRNFDKESEMFD